MIKNSLIILIIYFYFIIEVLSYIKYNVKLQFSQKLKLDNNNQYESIYTSLKMTEFIEDEEFYHIDVTEEYFNLDHVVTLHGKNWNKYKINHHISQHTLEAYEKAKSFINEFYSKNKDKNNQQINTNTTSESLDLKSTSNTNNQKVILDSGCGTGLSTISIAKANPHLPVIGIDRSKSRLEKALKIECEDYNNILILRADLIDLWILILDNPDWIIDQHYLLYPNPYPKNKHFKRRFHGHPIFPALLALGGDLTVRSNWNIYCQEFIRALSHYSPLLGDDVSSESNSNSNNNSEGNVNGDKDNKKFECEVKACSGGMNVDDKDQVGREPMTNFERKYMAVGVPLFEVKASLGKRGLKRKKEFLQQLSSILPSTSTSTSASFDSCNNT